MSNNEDLNAAPEESVHKDNNVKQKESKKGKKKGNKGKTAKISQKQLGEEQLKELEDLARNLGEAGATGDGNKEEEEQEDEKQNENEKLDDGDEGGESEDDSDDDIDEGDDAEEENSRNKNKKLKRDEEDGEEVEFSVPQYIRMKKKLDPASLSKAQRKVRTLLEQNFPPSDEFDPRDQFLEADQLQVMVERSKKEAEIWPVTEKFKKPMTITQSNLGRATSDRAFFDIQNMSSTLQRITVGLMSSIAEKKPTEAMGKAFEIYRGLLHIEARSGEGRILLTNPRVAGVIGEEGADTLSKKQRERLEEYNRTKRAMSQTLRGGYNQNFGFGRGALGRGGYGSGTGPAGRGGVVNSNFEENASAAGPRKRGRPGKW